MFTCTLTALIAFSALGLSAAAPTTAAAATAAPVAASPTDASQFRGVNWARLGDNFTTGPLVLDGLSSSDSYATVHAKADAVYTGFQNNLGANTVRLPVNTHTVGTTWWNAYTGAIDAATAKGFKVILSYWEDGASSNGRITDMAAFRSMWNTVIAQYSSNSLVYFEPMNEPHGYSSTEWRNLAADWIAERPSLPRDRIFVSGTGYNTDVKPVCNDSRLDGTYLSLHHYAFFSSPKTYDQWVAHFRDAVGSCGSRTVLDEFGAPMDNGLDYNNPNSTDNFVRHIRAATDSVRALNMGAVYWPGLGGKITSGTNHDWYSIQALHGSGTNLTLSTRNTTGVDRLKYAWGTGNGSGTTTLRNTGSSNCLDIPDGTHDNTPVQIYACNTTSAQQWTRTATGTITAINGTKCLDAYNAGTANGTVVGTYTCNGQNNQKWTFHSDGTIRNAQSGLCLDIDTSTSQVQLWSCWAGANQKWQTG
jgi:hypothetical protein